MPGYRSFAHSTKGAKHQEHEPCQDCACAADFDNEQLSVAIVADGHGSPQYFRSDKGSRIAAEHAMAGIKKFVEGNPFAIKNLGGAEIFYILRRLAANIINSWIEAIEADEGLHPLKDDEKILALDDKYKNRYLQQHECARQAYGTTLMAIAMAGDYWFGLHIGDGKCQVLYEDGEWEQPIPWDKKCFANSTTSICDDTALDGFRYWFGCQDAHGGIFEFSYGPGSDSPNSGKRPGKKPVAIFIGSDGVDDTYSAGEDENKKQLESLYRKIVLNIGKDGFDSTAGQVLGLLERLAESGSRDDVSMAGIIGDMTPPLLEALGAQSREGEDAAEDPVEKQKTEEADKHEIHAERAESVRQMQ